MTELPRTRIDGVKGGIRQESGGFRPYPTALYIPTTFGDESLAQLWQFVDQICSSDALRSGQVWWHSLEQRVAASFLRRYSLGLRLAIAQADARPARPVSLR